MTTLNESASRSQAPSPSPPSPPPFPDPIPGVIDFGTVNILAGASGVGKTCLLSTILTRIRDGGRVFGRQAAAPTAIGMVCADRGTRTARHWLRLAGFPDLALYALAEDPSFNTIALRNKFQLVPVLERCIDQLALPPGGLVIVDPVTLFLGNPNDYQGCAIACIELRRMVQRKSLTMIGTAHSSKQKADAKAQYKRLQDRILGSAAQLGYGDTQMYLASPEETNEKFYTFLWHPHTAEAQAFPLGRDQHGLFVDWHEGVEARQEGKILAVITEDEEGTGFADIVIKSEVPRATVFRYLQDLIKDGRILKVGHGRYKRVKAN